MPNFSGVFLLAGVELCASRFDIARTNLWSYEQSDPEHVKRPPPPPTPAATRKTDRRFAAVAAVEHTSKVYPTPRLYVWRSARMSKRPALRLCASTIYPADNGSRVVC